MVSIVPCEQLPLNETRSLSLVSESLFYHRTDRLLANITLAGELDVTSILAFAFQYIFGVAQLIPFRELEAYMVLVDEVTADHRLRKRTGNCGLTPQCGAVPAIAATL